MVRYSRRHFGRPRRRRRDRLRHQPGPQGVRCRRRGGTERWSFDTGRQISAAPAVADGVVYVGSESEAVYGIDAAEGTELWSMDTTRPVSAAPAVVDGTVYIGTESGALYALEDGFASAAPATGGDDGADDGGGAGPTESPSPFEDLSYLAVPLTVASVVTAIAGGYYTLTRVGAFDSVDSASEVFGDEADTDEPAATESEPATTESTDETTTDSAPEAPTKSSQLWQLIVDDVTNRAGETKTRAIEDFVVTKHLDRDTLSAPVLVYEIESVRDEPARVRLTEPLISADGDTNPLGDSWELTDDELVFETVVDPGETVTTLVGRPDCPAEHADDLLKKPTVSVDPVSR
ncbi:PQQ-binding-like beta-propeller repeat protein [Halovenus salina]|uniref:PQQ-binding-like beta-propeller repeat protein n=1 Tax=Halovenus salina TaxID=1510225 RepID=A0ABD5W7M0_9EURY